MAERRGAPTAEERLAALEHDRERLRRERLRREVAGPRWRRMVRVTPCLFQLEGRLEARRLLAGRAAVIEALRAEAVFAFDTALRLSRGFGVLAGGDVFAYLASAEPLQRLARDGLIAAEPHADRSVVRAWPGPPRLIACVVAALPAHERLASGHMVVGDDRVRRELIGAVGPRADLFALVETPAPERARRQPA